MERLNLDSDHVVTIPELTDDEGQTITSATVEMTLYERDKETEIGGVSWPVSLTHQGDGKYTGDLSRSIQVSNGQIVALKVTGTYNTKQLVGWKDAYVARYEL